LRGEKIDIIEYNDDPVTFAANALSPAKINHVSVVDAEQKHLEVIVDDSQLSLAIGKKGQNVRLAAKLLGWRIDIKSEEEKRQEIESQMAAMALRGAPISDLKGLGEKTMQRLRDHGIETVEQLAQTTPDDLTQIQGIGEKTVEKIRKIVTDYFEAGREAEESAATEEAAAPAEPEAAEESPATEEAAVPAEPGAASTTEGTAEAESAPQEEASAGEVSGQEEATAAAEEPAKSDAGAEEENAKPAEEAPPQASDKAPSNGGGGQE